MTGATDSSSGVEGRECGVTGDMLILGRFVVKEC